MTVVRFEKWEGLGNDFVVIRDLGRDLGRDIEDAEVQRLCDRRFGVGADGVLLVETAEPRMVVRNADGSRPEMCGNGLRCVVGSLALPDALGAMVVTTDAGPKACRIVRAQGDEVEVEVDMGTARKGEDLVATVAGRERRFLTMDMGNPHAISFEPFQEPEVDVIGPSVEKLPPGGTNVEFCAVERPSSGTSGARIRVTVWERGVGRTLACGTGACAVAAAACDTGRARFGEPATVALPGGELVITVEAGSRAVRMRGPARRVFVGEVVIA